MQQCRLIDRGTHLKKVGKTGEPAAVTHVAAAEINRRNTTDKRMKLNKRDRRYFTLHHWSILWVYVDDYIV